MIQRIRVSQNRRYRDTVNCLWNKLEVPSGERDVAIIHDRICQTVIRDICPQFISGIVARYADVRRVMCNRHQLYPSVARSAHIPAVLVFHEFSGRSD